MRQLRYETGAMVAMFKPYGERYLGLIEDLMENPPEETPGWHASEQETSIMLAYNPANVHMERAVDAPRACARLAAGRLRQSDDAGTPASRATSTSTSRWTTTSSPNTA